MALLFLTPLANAAEEKIDSALSAAPTSLSRDARVMDWDGKVLRQGNNGYTCLPDIPDNGGPWIMWPDTPYAHLMIPIDSYPK